MKTKIKTLKKESLIKLVFSSRSVSTKHLKIFYLLSSEITKFPAINYGIVVPKKNIALATKRNKIKRRLKSSVFNSISENSASLSFFIVYKSRKMLDYKVLKEDVSLLLTKIKNKSF